VVEIRIKRLTKVFPPNVVALEDINLDIKHNEFLVVLGPSGSGKTTFLRILAGLERPTQGYVSIGDKVVVDTTSNIFVPPQKRNIGMVFQNWALYPNMKVFDNIAFPLKIKKVPESEIRKKVREVAEILDIEGVLDRYPRQISGGQQQRVALARALVKEPEVLLLDEPLSNLDALIRLRLRGELKRLQRKLGITAIHVTHDQTEALSMGDFVVVMNDGRIQQTGSPEEVYDKPKNLFVAGFLGSPPTNMLKAKLRHGVEGPYIDIAGVYTLYDIPSNLLDILENLGTTDVIVAFRPEHAQISREPVQKRNSLSLYGEVYVVEPLGREIIATIYLSSGDLIKIVLPPTMKLDIGDEVYVVVPSERIMLFDPETGLNLEYLVNEVEVESLSSVANVQQMRSEEESETV